MRRIVGDKVVRCEFTCERSHERLRFAMSARLRPPVGGPPEIFPSRKRPIPGI